MLMEDKEVAKAVETLAPEAARLYQMRHSLAHVMAQAVLHFYPGTKLGFGPPIENGFYYDFDLPDAISAEDLPKIEKKMRQILGEHQTFTREEMSTDEAVSKVRSLDQPYKEEQVRALKERGVDRISFYSNGPFVDMCEGPHVAETGEIPGDGFRLDSIAGAYWKGSEKNKMLTRIYGLAFPSRQELKDYLARRELARERDHKKLGRELELFHIDEEVGKGLILWLPKGTVLRNEVERLAVETEFLYGYQRVATPHISKEGLYYKSGHLPYYKADMFPPMELVEEAPGGAGGDGDAAVHKETFYLKPMNCPHHHLIYAVRPRSYRELPLRLAEYGTVYRYEQSGELSGLLRVRMLSMNDAHIYCTKGQLKQEIASVLKMYRELYQVFEFERWEMRLSLHDPARKEKYHDDETLWEESERALREAIDELGLAYVVGEDEAAFYGPKIDIQFRNLLGREETVSTVQVDYLAAKKFHLSYVDEHGVEQPPVVIHRAPLSTHERFMAYLIEHYGGAFPTWLAPVQVRLLPISDEQMPYAEELAATLHRDMVRVEVDRSTQSLNKKVRVGTVEKIPILLVLGKREAQERTVTVRRYRIQRQETLSFEEFRTQLLEEISSRIHHHPES
jgi:threonyl-tRNA synthetase